MRTPDRRSAWLSYLRVSTPEQAERDLSLAAPRRAVDEYAARAGQNVTREYLEEGCSGTHMNRKALRQMLEDVFRRGSDIGTIVVHHEAAIVRQLFQLYVAGNGAKSVASTLNEHGLLYRRGAPWSKDLVFHVLDEPAVAGTYFWGRWSAKRKKWRNEAEWLPLKVDPIVERSLYELAMKLRKNREPKRNPGRPVSKENLLAGLVRCGKCGASYQLETSGKRVNGDLYQYRHYNCRTFCRVGSSTCPGGRIPTKELDDAVLEHVASAVCTSERCESASEREPVEPCGPSGRRLSPPAGPSVETTFSTSSSESR